MNQSEKKYAKERLADIYSRRRQALRDKYTTAGVQLTPAERAKVFKQGRFTVNKDVTAITEHTDVVDVVTFSGEVAKKFDTAKYEADIANLGAEYTAILDELMLGNAEEALKLLKRFDK